MYRLSRDKDLREESIEAYKVIVCRHCFGMFYMEVVRIIVRDIEKNNLRTFLQWRKLLLSIVVEVALSTLLRLRYQRCEVALSTLLRLRYQRW